MNAYRVDRRLFKAGDVVPQTGVYLTKLDSDRALVEKCLANRRPDTKPRRSEVLFVFESRIFAERFWMKEVDGKFYEVNIRGPLLHRGDMSLTDEMFLVRTHATRPGELAERYWRGGESSHPQIELLVKDAVVVNVLFTTEADRRRAFAARAGMPLPNMKQDVWRTGWHLVTNAEAHQVTGSTASPDLVFPYDIQKLPSQLQELRGLYVSYISGYSTASISPENVSVLGEVAAVRADEGIGKGYVWVFGISGSDVYINGPYKYFDGHHFQDTGSVPVEKLFGNVPPYPSSDKVEGQPPKD